MDFPVFLHFSMIFHGCSMMFHDFPWHFWRVAPRCCSDVVISSKAEASRTVVSGHTLFHTPSFTHHLSHTIFVNHLCQPPSFTHHRSTLRGRRGTWWHPPSFCVVGVALSDSHLRFAWQAWHLATSSFVSRSRRGTWWNPLSFLRGRRGTYGTAWRAWTAWSPVTPRHFASQAWQLVTSTFVLRGRRGTCRHPPSLCVAGVALMALRGALGRLGRRWRRGTLRGRRGTWWHPPSFCVAGVALGNIHLRSAW